MTKQSPESVRDIWVIRDKVLHYQEPPTFAHDAGDDRAALSDWDSRDVDAATVPNVPGVPQQPNFGQVLQSRRPQTDTASSVPVVPGVPVSVDVPNEVTSGEDQELDRLLLMGEALWRPDWLVLWGLLFEQLHRIPPEVLLTLDEPVLVERIRTATGRLGFLLQHNFDYLPEMRGLEAELRWVRKHRSDVYWRNF